jgi:RNA polymerase sigma-70 factor (ECF subfamily)
LQEEEEFIQQLLNPKTQNEAFQKLLLTYQNSCTVTFGIILNHDDTDDVLQNTFIKVFQNLKISKEKVRLFSLMYCIAK